MLIKNREENQRISFFFIKLFLLFSIIFALWSIYNFVNAEEWIVSQTNWDTVIHQIKEGDTVWIDWSDTPTFFRCCDILFKGLGEKVIKYKWGEIIVNRTGYCDFYIILRRRGKYEVVRK